VPGARAPEHLFFASTTTKRRSDLQIYIIFTNPLAINVTLEAANELAHDLDARLTVLIARIVPYPLPLEHPPVSTEFTEQFLSQLVKGPDVATTVHVLLCRDRNETIRRAVRPDSIVLIGSRKRWWPNRDNTLARRLRRDGHHVIVLNLDHFDTNR
jgi:hypothetical protein